MFSPGREPTPSWPRGGGGRPLSFGVPALQTCTPESSVVAAEGFACLDTLHSYRTVSVFPVDVTVELRSRVLRRHFSVLVLRLTVACDASQGPPA